MFTFNKEKMGTGFELLPAGKYEVFIDTAVTGFAKSGNPQIKMKLKVRDDVEAQSQFKNRVLFYDLTYTDKTEFLFMNLLGAVQAPEGANFGSLEDIADYVAGKAVLADVSTRDYNGKTYQDVKSVTVTEVGGGRVDSPLAPTSNTPPAPPVNYTPTYSGKPANPAMPTAPAAGVGHEDPFANAKGPIEVNEDDLPF